MDNPYKVLELNPGASIDDVKAAYKRLAKKYHPDLNPNNPAAEEMFKRISVAYDEIISGRANKSKSQNYQNFESDFDAFFSDVFGRNFNNSGFKTKFKREFYNENINVTINITLEDIFYGAEKQSKIQFPDGTIKTVDYKIPHFHINRILCLKNKGIQTNKNLPPGDINIKFRIIEHSTFKILDRVLQPSTLIMDLKINVLELILGCDKEIKTICGSLINLKVPPSNTSLLKVSGKGLWNKDMTRGDLLVNIIPIIPKITDTNSLEKIKEILKNQE